MALTRKDVLLLNTHTAVPHARFGNERAWSVTGGNLKRGQIVHLHAMCTAKTAIKKAIAQDAAEILAPRCARCGSVKPSDRSCACFDNDSQ